MRCWTRRSVIAAGLSLAGCAAIDRPRLGHLYGGLSRPVDQPPVILIPGAFGSSLRDVRTGREIWPISDASLLLGNYRELGVPFDLDTLQADAGHAEAYAVLRSGLGRDFYGNVIDTLQRVGGYDRFAKQGGGAGEDSPCSLYVYLYDFRLDNVRAAQGLAALIERVREEHGDPSLRVDVVAHSNGGLVARYFVRHGARDIPASGPFEPTYAGAMAIRRLLLIGTPNLGTLQPVLSLLRGEEIGLRHIPPEVVATCPGIPQMMPHPAVPWLVDLGGRVLPADIYDIETWREFGWSLFDAHIAERTIADNGGGASGRRYLDRLRAYLARSLVAGRRFTEAFTLQPDPPTVPIWVFGGDCEPTLSRLVVESVAGELHARERPDDIVAPGMHPCVEAMFEPGDAVVTRSSLLGRRTLDVTASRSREESQRLAHAMFFCERHQQLTGNALLQDNLLHALLSADAA